MTNKLLFTISGPSGVGKTTIAQALLTNDTTLCKSISWTTRKPRESEVDGVDYHFVSRETFEQSIRDNLFIEWIEHLGVFYGTHIDDINSSVADMLLVIEMYGAKRIKELFKDKAISIFISPPNLDELTERLILRGTDSFEVIKVRLENARNEMALAKHSDCVVCNDNLENAVQHVKDIIIAERIKNSCFT